MRILFFFLVSLSFFGCSGKSKEGDTSLSLKEKPSSFSSVIGSLGGESITQEDFRLWNPSLFQNRRSLPLDRLEKMRKDFVRFKLVSKLSDEEGFSSKPEVRRVLLKTIFQMYMQKKMQSILKKVKEEQLDHQMLLEFYQKKQEMFQVGERRRVSAIILKNCTQPSFSKNCKTKSLSIARLLHEKPFPFVVEAFSDDRASKQRLGDMGFLYPVTSPRAKLNRFPRSLVNIIYGLKQVGSISNKVCDGTNCYWFQVTGILPPKVLSFESQKSKIQSILQRKMVKEELNSFFVDLEKKYNVTLNKEAFAEAYKGLAK